MPKKKLDPVAAAHSLMPRATTPEEQRETFAALLKGNSPPAAKVALLALLQNSGREMTLAEVCDAANLRAGEAEEGLHALVRRRTVLGNPSHSVWLSPDNEDLIDMLGHLVFPAPPPGVDEDDDLGDAA